MLSTRNGNVTVYCMYLDVLLRYRAKRGSGKWNPANGIRIANLGNSSRILIHRRCRLPPSSDAAGSLITMTKSPWPFLLSWLGPRTLA